MRTFRLRLEVDIQADGDQLLCAPLGKAIESLDGISIGIGEKRDVSEFFETGVSAAITVTGFHQRWEFADLTDEDGEPW